MAWPFGQALEPAASPALDWPRAAATLTTRQLSRPSPAAASAEGPRQAASVPVRGRLRLQQLWRRFGKPFCELREPIHHLLAAMGVICFWTLAMDLRGWVAFAFAFALATAPDCTLHSELRSMSSFRLVLSLDLRSSPIVLGGEHRFRRAHPDDWSPRQIRRLDEQRRHLRDVGRVPRKLVDVRVSPLSSMASTIASASTVTAGEAEVR
jgi:hypothetical protein